MNNKPKEGHEFIYQLYVVPYDDTPIYIGRTNQTLKARLGRHLSEARGQSQSKKCCGLRALQAEGFEISISLLQDVDMTNTHGDEEDLHITNAEGKGIKLLNGKSGDTDRFITIDDVTLCAWDVEAFRKDWAKGEIGCPASKMGKFIHGILFVRTGWSNLYLIHPVYGRVECPGFVWDKQVERAITTMTKGTPEYKKMVDNYKRTLKK